MKNTKKHDHGLLHQKILLQLLKEDADPFNILSPAEPEGQSIADLTNIAKQEIISAKPAAPPVTENK